jgi:hypothetical protein
MIALAAAGAGLTACGKGGSSLVQDVRLRAYDGDDGRYVEARALLETLNLNFGVTLPILNPNDPVHPYGSVGLNPAVGARGSELTLALNLDKARLGGGVDGGTLPSGAPIPVSTGGTPVLGFRAGTHSTVYLALDDKVAMLGAALVIPEFDSIARSAPGVNLFPVFDLSNGVRGVAGIFTGLQPDRSGVALFVDAASVLHGSVPAAGVLAAASVKPAESPLAFRPGRASAGIETRVYRELIRIGERHRRLRAR